MPRDGNAVRRRLQAAALELFRERGFEETTAAEIAARAGVTERTFFRHFPDKREVLFANEEAFNQALKDAVHEAPPKLGALETLFVAFNAVASTFVDNQAFLKPRRTLIDTYPPLRERAAAKSGAVIALLASALRERGLSAPRANLAAQVGAATLSYAVAAWFADDCSVHLKEHIAEAFQEVRDLSLQVKRPGKRGL